MLPSSSKLISVLLQGYHNSATRGHTGFLHSFYFFYEKGEGHPETVPSNVIMTMTKDTDHVLQGYNNRGA